MKFSSIIFDMDGTIINSEPVLEIATKALLESKGITIDQTQKNNLKKQLHGIGIKVFGHFIKETFKLDETPEQIILEQNILIKKYYEQEIKFIDGFVDFHKQVRDFSLKSGVATNADYHTVEISRKKFGLENFFGQHIYCIEDVNNISKPKPDVYLHAADKLETPAHMCVAIEDSKCGIEAAKNADMFCIGINTSKDKNALKHADLIVECYQEIDLDKILKKIQ